MRQFEMLTFDAYSLRLHEVLLADASMAGHCKDCVISISPWMNFHHSIVLKPGLILTDGINSPGTRGGVNIEDKY